MSDITSCHQQVPQAPSGSHLAGGAGGGARVTARRDAPSPQGLYDRALDKDSCGVGFIADIKGRASHRIVTDALTILVNLEHRGAVGADPRAGDGAGILVQIPHRFFARKAAELGLALPAPGGYAVGVLFMPQDQALRAQIKGIFAEEIAREGMHLVGWRNVPSDNSCLGDSVKPTAPFHEQVFIGMGSRTFDADTFERRLYVMRKAVSQRLYGLGTWQHSEYYPVSLSCRTVIYKGMFLADQLRRYYPDLEEPDFESA
ncbi:MAG: glutamate synthase subunit alpha, partial [Bradyrhizobiaceae bacterium]|nr:glutamate synthase subunit alpha [Bradyrhizobiaceae bacterium]